MKDDIGDRMKLYEMMEAGRKFVPLLPIVARLDGMRFSVFTRGLKRPYDKRLSDLMIETTKYLVEETNAVCGYTQSDEITLAWHSNDFNVQTYFDGRISKIISVLAAKCSVQFNKLLHNAIPEKSHTSPVFDCRAWQMPNIDEATNAFLWREIDATKNSITMAAQEFYEHNELEGVTGDQKQELLFQKGINWNDYPTFFKRGTYIQRKKRIIAQTFEDIEKLPLKHHARTNLELIIERSNYEVIDMPPLRKVINRANVIFYGELPEVETSNIANIS